MADMYVWYHQSSKMCVAKIQTDHTEENFRECGKKATHDRGYDTDRGFIVDAGSFCDECFERNFPEKYAEWMASGGHHAAERAAAQEAELREAEAAATGPAYVWQWTVSRPTGDRYSYNWCDDEGNVVFHVDVRDGWCNTFHLCLNSMYQGAWYEEVHGPLPQAGSQITVRAYMSDAGWHVSYDETTLFFKLRQPWKTFTRVEFPTPVEGPVAYDEGAHVTEEKKDDDKAAPRGCLGCLE